VLSLQSDIDEFWHLFVAHSVFHFAFLVRLSISLLCVTSLLYVFGQLCCLLYMHCLIVVSSTTCFSCVASLLCINEIFQHFLFMYLSNHLWCFLSLLVVRSWCSFKVCLVPFQICIYPSIFLMWKHGRRFFCNFFFNYQPKLQVTCGHIKCWKNILYVFNWKNIFN